MKNFSLKAWIVIFICIFTCLLFTGWLVCRLTMNIFQDNSKDNVVNQMSKNEIISNANSDFRINLKIGDTTVTAELEDNEATRNLLKNCQMLI